MPVKGSDAAKLEMPAIIAIKTAKTVFFLIIMLIRLFALLRYPKITIL